MWSIQREPSFVPPLHRWLQLPRRLRMERPLRHPTPSTPLQVSSITHTTFLLIPRLDVPTNLYSVWICRVSSKIDAVLLSHSDTLHLGALPYAMKHLGLSAPVYSTEPVYRLGLLSMYDHYLSRKVSFFIYLFLIGCALGCFLSNLKWLKKLQKLVYLVHLFESVTMRDFVIYGAAERTK